MAPPRTNTAPLLRDLDGVAVAKDVCSLVIDHLRSVSFALAPAVELHLVGHAYEPTADPLNPKIVPADVTPEALAGGSDLGLTVQALVAYAQRGLPVWDWETSGEASDGCLSVFSALYTSAGTPDLGGGIVDMADDVEPEDAVGVVLLAALARIKLDQRHPLALRELAVLSGLSLRMVQTLVARGELAAKEDGPRQVVRPRDAARWLEARGVPGFGRHEG